MPTPAQLLIGRRWNWKLQPVLPPPLVASVLMLAACWQTSLSGACRLVKDPPGHEPFARPSILPAPQAAPTCSAPCCRSASDPARSPDPPAPVVALDMHQRPFYGNKKGTTKGCTTSGRKRPAHATRSPTPPSPC